MAFVRWTCSCACRTHPSFHPHLLLAQVPRRRQEEPADGRALRPAARVHALDLAAHLQHHALCAAAAATNAVSTAAAAANTTAASATNAAAAAVNIAAAAAGTAASTAAASAAAANGPNEVPARLVQGAALGPGQLAHTPVLHGDSPYSFTTTTACGVKAVQPPAVQVPRPRPNARPSTRLAQWQRCWLKREAEGAFTVALWRV